MIHGMTQFSMRICEREISVQFQEPSGSVEVQDRSLIDTGYSRQGIQVQQWNGKSIGGRQSRRCVEGKWDVWVAWCTLALIAVMRNCSIKALAGFEIWREFDGILRGGGVKGISSQCLMEKCCRLIILRSSSPMRTHTQTHNKPPVRNCLAKQTNN